MACLSHMPLLPMKAHARADHTLLTLKKAKNDVLSFPFLLVLPQVTSANAFAQTLRRYTSLNHLAQAARAVLQNTAQINQMLSDLNRVDFANVQVGLVSAFGIHVASHEFQCLWVLLLRTCNYFCCSLWF